jgi:DNA (cytosine-5)-methyltransferase 1
MLSSAVAKAWPTPTVKGDHNKKGLSEKSGDGLSTAAKAWATPTAQQYGSNQGGGMGRVGPVRPSLSGQAKNNTNGKPRGSLNPDWVDQLQGIPAGWTAYDWPETE